MKKFFENSGGKPTVKKMLSSILAVATIVSVMTACGGSTGSTVSIGGNAEEKEFSLKIGDDWRATHSMATVLDNVFEKQIEEKSGGEIKVDVYHDGLLGDEAVLWQAVRDGSVDFTVVGTPMNQEFPMTLISDWPFLYRDLGHVKKVRMGPIADKVSSESYERFPEVELLGWGPNSAYTFTPNKKLMSVEDFAGQKSRMPNNPTHVGITQNLGASATVIPLGELFTALETGTVDGQDSGMVTVLVQSFQEVQRYLYETSHIVATLEIAASTDKLEEMSENQRQIIRDAAKATAVQARGDYTASIDRDHQTLIDAGVIVTACPDEDRAEATEKTQPAIDKLPAENDWAEGLTEGIEVTQ